jgi:hypothetical protein
VYEMPTIRPGDVTGNLERLGRQIGRVLLEPPDRERVRPAQALSRPSSNGADYVTSLTVWAFEVS